MRKIRYLAFLIGFTLSGVSGAVEVGSVIPGVSIQSLSNYGSEKIELSSLDGKVVYVDFWASWCGPCKKSFPELNKLYEQHHKNGFEIVAVNLDESVQDAQGFLKNYPVDFPVATDPNGVSAELFAIKGMPSGYLIDKKGVVRHIVVGFADGEAEHLDKLIGQLMAE